ncbi:MAG: TldD/PmbA family protein [Candidatus Tectomicrobia bacterium]|nr:TldD/PmbA family protein [Candidatus Tectomicrobia bacterium]
MIERNLANTVLEYCLERGADFAELFLEEKDRTTLHFASNEVERAVVGTDFGAGLRLFYGTNSVYTYTNDVSRDGLMTVARSAAALEARAPSRGSLRWQDRQQPLLHACRIDPSSVELARKAELLRRANEAARSHDSLIDQVNITYVDEDQRVLVANSEGTFVEDRRVRTRLSISAVASLAGEKQVGAASPGACRGFEFYDDLDVEAHAREAAETAVRMVRAAYAPTGKMVVVLNNAFGGVIFHEASGHGLEAYAVARKASIFGDRMGKAIASKVVSAVDDGTLPHEWGSQTYDDEGNLTQRTLLIENGILKSWLVDKLSARKLGLTETGSGRRESYRYAPVSRMRNTYILPGERTQEEMIAATEYGLFAKKMGGGSVNPATGDFNFAVQEGYLIEKGKITRPVRGASLIGNGAVILRNIDMVGNDLQLAPGMCGASSGAIPVNVGQPSIRVRDLLVGGRGE